MLVIRIWNYFRGYVIIRVEGLTLEKFINLAIARNIYLWDIVRLDYTTLESKVGIKGFKELREVVRRVGCRVSIVGKKGYPFFIHRFKYRKMLAFGFVIALAIIIVLTSFVWSINIKGNESTSIEEILGELENLGVKPGTFKGNVNIEEIKKQLLTQIDYLTFVSAEVKGTRLIIEIKESETRLEIVNKDFPCNIIAGRKAVIEKIVAKNGKSVVKKGDIVLEGQMLITGVIQHESMEEPLLVHSEGEVFGKTWYNKEISEPISKNIKEETGKVHITKEIKIGDKRVHLISGEIPFENYVEEIEARKIIDWKEFSLPLEIIEHKYKEVKVKKVTQNVDALKQKVSVIAVQDLMKELSEDARVISKDVQYSIVDNVLITKITIEVIKEIGKKQKINSSY